MFLFTCDVELADASIKELPTNGRLCILGLVYICV